MAGNGFVGREFIDWLNDSSKVAFPWSMIDKITPRPSEVVRRSLAGLGLELPPVVTGKGTYIAPYVNAEIPEYLVIEDSFPNGRPPLEKAGVYFTDRDTVNKVERMKVTVCLNPLHTALAVFGCLLGFDSIAGEMGDADLRRLVERIGYDEGLPVVSDPGIFNPADFLRETLEKRLPNPFIPDMPQRIATDTSQKMPIRFGETIKSYVASDTLDVGSLVCIPLAIAGWLRYLLGVDDRLLPMELSGDPLLPSLREMLVGVEAGEPGSYAGQLRQILSRKELFGCDLTATPIGERVEGYFVRMLEGKGAVRLLLHEVVFG